MSLDTTATSQNELKIPTAEPTIELCMKCGEESTHVGHGIKDGKVFSEPYCQTHYRTRDVLTGSQNTVSIENKELV